MDLLYDITNPYGFRDWDWGEFKLYPDLDLEERINQFEILKAYKDGFVVFHFRISGIGYRISVLEF